jgi:exosortase
MPVAVASPSRARDERDETAASELTSSARVLLALVGIELVLLYAPTARWLYDRWTMSVWHNAHGFLIPPAVAYFSWQALRPLRGLPRDSSPWGFAFLVPAIVAHVLDTGIQSQILSAVSIVIALPGLALLFLGSARAKAIAFPLAFALFMLPLPLAVTERIHLVGRQLATAGAAHILPLLGITVFSEGTSLHLANGILLVGDGCSGFSTVYAACAVAALSAFACNYWLGRILTLLSAIPLALAANVVRVILLAALVRWQGLGVLDTWLHPASGMLTFVLSLPVIFWLGTPRPTPAEVLA